MNIYKIFTDMRKLPKGFIIDNPHDLIYTNFKLSNKILNIINTNTDKVFFTRLSIKHLSEKQEQGEYIIKKIRDILSDPDKIFLGNFYNRFLITKNVKFNNDYKNHIVNIEITKENKNIIITGFIARKSYFKNLKLLWGAAPTPSQLFKKRIGGSSRFSALREV